MHPALRLEEILYNVFGHCHSNQSNKHRNSRATADLAALARTCCMFKEPALDALWAELTNLSPLARCLPEASHRIYHGYTWYSFSRPLKQSEWAVLRNYTRRVRFVLDFTRGLNWESVKAVFNPPTPHPMFPNLRSLRWEFIRETFPLMHHLAVTSLTSLEINFVFGDVPPFHSFPQSLAELCPNIRRFRIRMRRPQIETDETVSGLVCRWTNLQALYCPYVSLNADALTHLSYTSSLTHVSFALKADIPNQIVSCRTVLLFSKLRELEICCQSLETLSRLLVYVRLPSAESLTVNVDVCPSNHALRAYLDGLKKVCTLESLASLKLVQVRSPSTTHHGLDQQLTVDDMRPCMSFSHLRRLDMDAAWTVHLTDDDVFELASACPRLEHLLINEGWGWQTRGGISPDGLVQLLEKLGSLDHICLAIDTRRCRDFSVPPMAITPQRPFYINVADSAIEPESVDALASFFARLHVNTPPCYWNTTTMTDRMESEMSRRLWEGVFMKASEMCARANVFDD